jgi:hypothetical protein
MFYLCSCFDPPVDCPEIREKRDCENRFMGSPLSCRPAQPRTGGSIDQGASPARGALFSYYARAATGEDCSKARIHLANARRQQPHDA